MLEFLVNASTKHFKFQVLMFYSINGKILAQINHMKLAI